MLFGVVTGCNVIHKEPVVSHTLPTRIKMIETYKYVLDNPVERNDNFTRFTVIQDTETNVSYLVTQSDDRIVVTRLDGKQ